MQLNRYIYDILSFIFFFFFLRNFNFNNDIGKIKRDILCWHF